MINSSSYYHSGFPPSWIPKYMIYALYSSQLDCFLYVNHDLDTIRRVHYLMSSKIPTWVHRLYLPPEIPGRGISNTNPELWTVQKTIFDLEISQYQLNHNELVTLNCTEVNVLGDLAGQIELRPSPADEEAIKLKDWALFLGHVVMLIKQTELPEDEILHRIMMANSIHTKSNILDDDLSYFISNIYQLLLTSLSVEDFVQRFKTELSQNKSSYSRINKRNSFALWEWLLS